MAEPRLLFIDPGSKSTGWCVTQGDLVMGVGTIKAGTLQPLKGVVRAGEKATFDRLGEIAGKYRELMTDLAATTMQPSAAYFECIPRSCAPEVPWSIGAIGAAIAPWTVPRVPVALMPTQWQRGVGWRSPEMRALKDVTQLRPGRDLAEGSPLLDFYKDVDSKDALAAVGLAVYWLSLPKERRK